MRLSLISVCNENSNQSFCTDSAWKSVLKYQAHPTFMCTDVSFIIAEKYHINHPSIYKFIDGWSEINEHVPNEIYSESNAQAAQKPSQIVCQRCMPKKRGFLVQQEKLFHISLYHFKELAGNSFLTSEIGSLLLRTTWEKIIQEWIVFSPLCMCCIAEKEYEWFDIYG